MQKSWQIMKKFQRYTYWRMSFAKREFLGTLSKLKKKLFFNAEKFYGKI